MLHANFVCLCFIERELLPIEVLHYGNRPLWSWPDDLYTRTRSVFPGDILHLLIWTSYMKAFKNYRLADRHTDRHASRVVSNVRCLHTAACHWRCVTRLRPSSRPTRRSTIMRWSISGYVPSYQTGFAMCGLIFVRLKHKDCVCWRWFQTRKNVTYVRWTSARM